MIDLDIEEKIINFHKNITDFITLLPHFVDILYTIYFRQKTKKRREKK